MTALTAAGRYFDAWNARNAAAVVASLVPGGTYADPTTGGPISGDALAAYAGGLWQAFPDLTFEIVSQAETGGGRIAAEWLMRGTNTGLFRGLPPSGRTIELAGADFIETEAGEVKSVVGYFDGSAVPRQLGLQIIVQPHSVGPFSFGYSVQVQTGRTRPPGAISVTTLHARGDEQAAQVRDYSRQTMREMLDMEGFLGATNGGIGQRMYTISAWEDPEQPRQLMANGTHREAMKPFFSGEVASSGFTSVWVPARINPFWVRCDGCGKMCNAEADPTCACGTTLPEHPPYW